MAIYTFNINLNTIAPLTTDLSKAQSNAAAIDLMAVPYQNWNNDEDTNYNLVMTNINSAMPAPGKGGSSA
jgi:hypothetical protein